VHVILKGTSMMKVLCTSAAKCESGATAIEYALTAAIISVAVLTGGETLATAINDQFRSLTMKLDITSQEHTQPGGGGTSLVSSQSPEEGARISAGSTSRVPQP
jgi:pilus assembly protein Flp/PilA